MSAKRNYLFIHQNMPAQFVHVCRYLRDQGHQVVFITRNKHNQLGGVAKVQYELHREPNNGIHHYVKSTEAGVLYGQAVYRSVTELLKQGFKPDLVVGHCGWGETLFVKDALPHTPLINYFEFYYRGRGQDLEFDPEYPTNADAVMSARMRNTVNLLSLEACDRGVTPTFWQLSGYPAEYHHRISVIHEGVDTQAIKPNPASIVTLPDGRVIKPGQKTVTYVARNLEPYRGIHTFMRAIPHIQQQHPDADILVVGAEGVSYGRRLPEGDSYKKRLLEEVSFDASRVHFLGHLPTEPYRAVLQVSAAHIYLTYPFVLSWSMLESMSTGCLVIGSRTAPVQEVIEDGKNGLLVDFHDPVGLAGTVGKVLSEPGSYAGLRRAARETVLARYDLQSVCLPRQIALFNDTVS